LGGASNPALFFFLFLSLLTSLSSSSPPLLVTAWLAGMSSLSQPEGRDRIGLLTASETEYLTLEELVDINPTFTSGGREIELLTGSIGPFTRQLKLRVPLWAAQKLAHIGKCHIIPPDWMSVDALKDLLVQERERNNEFAELPKGFFEISRALLDLDEAGGIAEPGVVRHLLEDLEMLRKKKITDGLSMYEPGQLIVFNNVTQMELNTVRPFAINMMNRLKRMEAATIDNEEA